MKHGYVADRGSKPKDLTDPHSIRRREGRALSAKLRTFVAGCGAGGELVARELGVSYIRACAFLSGNGEPNDDERKKIVDLLRDADGELR